MLISVIIPAYNAGVGGRLEFFERVDFDGLLEEKNKWSGCLT